MLRHSAAPFGWPLWLARLLTAATTGLGLLLAAVAVVRRGPATAPRRPVADDASGQRLPT